jgi:hypothetical protein
VRAKLWPGGWSNIVAGVTWCHHTMDLPPCGRRPRPKPCPGRVGRSMVKTTITQTGQEPVCSFRERSRQERKGRSLRWRLTGAPDVHASAGSLILTLVIAVAAADDTHARRYPSPASPCCSCLPIACSCSSRGGSCEPWAVKNHQCGAGARRLGPSRRLGPRRPRQRFRSLLRKLPSDRPRLRVPCGVLPPF